MTPIDHVSAGHREDAVRPHPIEAHLTDRFWFLTEGERALLLRCVKEGNGFPVASYADDLAMIVQELAHQIDAEAEWARIERISSDEIIAELAAAGVDTEGGFARLRDSLLARGIDISREARERRYRQQEAWLDGREPDSLAAIVGNAQQSMKRHVRDQCTCTRSGYEGHPCPVHSR